MRWLLVVIAFVGCDGDGGTADPPIDMGAGASIGLKLAEDVPEKVTSGETLTVKFQILLDGQPTTADRPSTSVVILGGGSVGEIRLEGDVAHLDWVIGVAPVPQQLELTYGPASLRLDTIAQRDTPLTSALFSEVSEYLDDEGSAGSTEDLAFVGDSVVLGAPGGLLRLDAEGNIQRIPLSGEPIGRGWGVGADDAGTLWVVDGVAGTLVRVTPEGEVTTVLSEAEGEVFAGLNYVDVGPDGRIYATDPCSGRLVRYDPATDSVDAVLTFDRGVDGGPNGLVFRGDSLYTVTENTVILCQDPGVAEFDAPLAAVFRVPVSDDGFGEPELIADKLGIFGDGITIDAEGNLYAIADTANGLMLEESIVWVLPSDGRPPQKFLVAESGRLYANLEFGRGAFGARTLYLAMLAIPGLTDRDSRGLERVDVGILGAIQARPPR